MVIIMTVYTTLLCFLIAIAPLYTTLTLTLT
jgi:hypothetical protein